MLRTLLLVVACFVVQTSGVYAQGLLWSLPSEEGTWVRYFGDMKQIQERPDSARGPLEMSWQAELTFKALGTEEGNYKGKTCQCRWLEFKYLVGRQSATGIDAGPYGARIYKVLVPEEAIIGKVADERNIPVIMVPIIKGYSKSGNKPVEPVKEKVLTFYPLLGLFTYYPSLNQQGEAEETISLPQLGDVTARHLTGTEKLQSETSRSINEGEIWVTSEIPFGWASYKAKVIREQKDRLAPLEAFKKNVELQITMSAVEKGEGARSELTVADDGTVTVEEVPAEEPAEKGSPKEPASESPFEDAPAADEKPAGDAPAESVPAETPSESGTPSETESPESSEPQ